MTKYNPKDILLWILVTSVYPSNQYFQIRFEFLLAVLIGLKTENFKNSNLSRNEFIKFINEFNEKFAEEFSNIEDWQPFQQDKLIPFIYNQRKYFYFYDLLERPYEYIEHIAELYFIRNKKYNELERIKNIFEFSLEYQNNLINQIFTDLESETGYDVITIPSEAFFNKISPFFHLNNHDFLWNNDDAVNIGDMQLEEQEIMNNFFDDTLFNGISVKISDDSQFYLLPQTHIPYLYKKAREIILNSSLSSEILEVIHEGFQQRLFKICSIFFTINKIYYKLFGTNKNELLTDIDLIVRIEENKLILLKLVKNSFQEDLTSEVNVGLNELYRVVDLIRNEKIIGVLDSTGMVHGALVQDLEIWGILVYENMNLDNRIFTNIDKKYNIGIFNYTDLKRIFEFFEEPFKIIQFLKNDKELREKSKILCFDFLDRFIFYKENGESYHRSGIIPTLMYFAPHDWHQFYNKFLFEKYQNDIYYLVEKRFPETFNEIKNYADNIYTVIERINLNGAMVVKYKEILIFIMFPPNAISCTDIEVRTFSNLLGPLYADYLNRLQKPLINLLNNLGFFFEKNYDLALYPTTYIERNKTLDFLKDYTAGISENEPLKIITKLQTNGKIKSCVLYDPEKLYKIFDNSDNSGEKYCINQLIESLILYFDNSITPLEAKKQAEEFVNRHIKIGPKGYTFEIIKTHNPKLREYPNYLEVDMSEINKVNKEIAKFIVDEKIKPGLYSNRDAININNKIFKFLENKLENEIKNYDIGLLYFAYKEIELINGKREMNKIQFGMDASKYTKYDIVKRNEEEGKKISSAFSAAKFIIETTLKIGLNGKNLTTTENWRYLQAISVVLSDTAVISDYIHYDIYPHQLEINSRYEINDIQGNETFDYKNFYTQESKSKIDIAKEDYLFKKEYIPKNNVDIDNTEIVDKELDESYLTMFGFRFKAMLTILFVLGSMDFNGDLFPLTKISMNTLVSKIKDNLKVEISENEILLILNYLSLSFSTFNKTDELIPTKMLTKKERIPLCPLIKLNSDELLYGNQTCFTSFNLWNSTISNGDFPYFLEESNIIIQAQKKLHEKLDKKLEREAEIIAKSILGDKKIEARINNFKRLSAKFPRNPDCGEIDLLAVNTDKKIIFVLDVKNLNRRIYPSAIRREMNKFFEGDKSYLNKLQNKEKFIFDNLEEVLKHFLILNIEAWKTKKVFVVNENYPSAFSNSYKVDFIMINRLSEFLL